MTQAPPGWYPDPGAPQGAPPHIRYWDGSTWTNHVQPAFSSPPPAAQPQAPAYGGPQQPAYGGPPHQPQPTGPTTADGERLSGWWWRVLAAFIDGVIFGIAVNVLTIPVQLDVQRDVNNAMERYLDTANNGETIDVTAFWKDLLDIYGDHWLGLFVVPIVLALAYWVGFLRWKGATPGKLICGLRVRLRERPGRLPWSTIVVRVGVQSILPWGVLVLGVLSGSIGLIALCYLVAMVFYLLDALWATWNKNRQTIHDLAAKTQVIKTR